MVDLAQTIEEWKDLQSVKVDDQVRTLLIIKLLVFSHQKKTDKYKHYVIRITWRDISVMFFAESSALPLFVYLAFIL